MSGQDHTARIWITCPASLLRLQGGAGCRTSAPYERVHGRIPTNGAFFRVSPRGCLVCLDCVPLSQLMARLDGLSGGKGASDR